MNGCKQRTREETDAVAVVAAVVVAAAVVAAAAAGAKKPVRSNPQRPNGDGP